MSGDDINADAISIVDRLKRAGLLTIAERAAARAELRLKDCISLGEVTGGHVALWRALLASGKTPRQVALLVQRREDVIVRETKASVAVVVVPEPRPTPVPKSGVRKTSPKPPAPVPPPPPGLTSGEVKAMIDATCAPLRGRIAELERRLSLFATDPKGGEELAHAHLSHYGSLGEVVRKVAHDFNVPIFELLFGVRSPMMTAARRECVRLLTRAPYAMSQTEIGRVLRLDPSTVFGMQRATGVTASRRRIRRAA